MSIIPAGKRREQVAQGPLKNQSILDSVLFEKVAVTPGALGPDKQQQPPQPEQPGGPLQDAMNNGSLGHDQMADNLEQDRNPPPEALQDQQPGIAPAGGAPADQFLGPAPVDESQQQGVDPYALEVQKIRKFIGFQNYGLKLDPQKDGSLQVNVIPPQGQPVDIGRLMEGLKQVTQGEWKGEETPAMATGGPVTLRYIPNSMGVQKVEKGGR